MMKPKEIGELLRNERERKGIPINIVHTRTRIQPNILKALEQGKAEEIIARIYVLAFLKKYAGFLELDVDKLVSEYKDFYAKETEPTLDLKEEPKAVHFDVQKWIIPGIYLALAIIVVPSTLFFGIKLRSVIGSNEMKKASLHPPHRLARREKVEIKTPVKPKRRLVKPKEKFIKLSVDCTDNVWMRIKRDGDVLFHGTLLQGETKWWTIEDGEELELWVGRAEVLNFKINEKLIGKVGEGVVKKILFSEDGLRVGDTWLLKSGE